MKVMKIATSAALAAAFVSGNAANAAEVIIDLFTDPVLGQTVSTATIGTFDTNQEGVFPASIIGGYRDLSITKLTDNFGLATQGDAALSVGAGTLTLDNATGVTSRGVITWDGINDAGNDGSNVNTTGLGGFDLTLNGSVDRILAELEYADLGFSYQISIWDMDGSAATLSAAVQFQVLSTYIAHYDFDWFQLADGAYCNGVSSPPSCTNPLTELDFTISRGGNLGSIDFTQIGALQLVLYNTEAYASADFALGSVKTEVPEPGVIALLGLGLLGAVTSRSRRSKRAI
jgi:hypothetical protein